MEPAKALNEITECADLIQMVEDLLPLHMAERGHDGSSGAMRGIRITLRNIRSTLLESQHVLAKELVSRARQPQTSSTTSSLAPIRQGGEVGGNSGSVSTNNNLVNSTSASLQDVTRSPGMPAKRDLKSALEKFVG